MPSPRDNALMRQMLDVVVDVRANMATSAQVAAVDARLRGVEQTVTEHKAEVSKVPGLEVRMRSMEDWRTEMRGSWKALVAIGGVVAFLAGAGGVALGRAFLPERQPSGQSASHAPSRSR